MTTLSDFKDVIARNSEISAITYDQFLEKLKALDDSENHKNMRVFNETLLRLQETDLCGWLYASMKIKERIKNLNE